jgi:hypothetical protein
MPPSGQKAIGRYGLKRNTTETRFLVVPAPGTQAFFIFIRPMKSRLPSGTPLVRRMS